MLFLADLSRIMSESESAIRELFYRYFTFRPTVVVAMTLVLEVVPELIVHTFQKLGVVSAQSTLLVQQVQNADCLLK